MAADFNLLVSFNCSASNDLPFPINLCVLNMLHEFKIADLFEVPK